METIFLYFGKMIICAAVMFAYYLLFLRDKTFHHYNRFYLLSTVVISMLLPLLKVEYFTIETDNRILLLLNQLSQSVPEKTESTFNFWNLAVLVLSGISLMLLAKIALGLVKIHQLKKEFPKESIEGITFYNTNLHDAPFSFFRNLFWKKSILLQSDLGRQILKHEMVHIEQKHSYDKLFIQVIQSLFWFNPIFYFIKKEINLIHEYLADKKAVKQSDTKAFAQMLLASSFSGNILPATSPFLSSNLKKRLQMLTQKTTKYSYARRILALPILFFVSFALLVNAKNTEIKKYNNEIAIAVQQLKNDTIKQADVQKLMQAHQEKIKKASEKLKSDNDKIKLLSDETRKKSEELQKIAKEKGEKSYEFELKAKELDQLGNEIDKIASSDEHRRNQKELEFNISNMEEFFSSDDFKNHFKIDEEQLKDIEKKFNTKEFKNGIVKIKKMRLPDNFDVEVPEPPMPPTFKENFNWKEKSNLSKEDQKKLEKLSKERAELAKKQAELAKKQAELAKKEAEISGIKERSFRVEVDGMPDSERVIVRRTSPKVFMFKNKEGNSMDDAKIYINGKLVTKEEMDKLSPDNIIRMDVNKNVNNGKEENEIKIQTK